MSLNDSLQIIVRYAVETAICTDIARSVLHMHTRTPAHPQRYKYSEFEEEVEEEQAVLASHGVDCVDEDQARADALAKRLQQIEFESLMGFGAHDVLNASAGGADDGEWNEQVGLVVVLPVPSVGCQYI